ncbi:MAG: sodium:solute symporter family protein [Rickettsiaceae bacterium]|nr:sodium:solute symporter family protein [Rickettsiaceae bacterium]
MVFDINVAVIVGFLIINLVVGLYYGRGIKNIKQYAIGDRNFNTATLTSTIVATWIGGSFFVVTVSQIYKDGIWFIISRLGDPFNLLIVGFILAPRLKNFFGSLSVAETMGMYYGKYARIITAIASIAVAGGLVALQVTIFSMIFGYFFNINNVYAIIISSIVVVTYSCFGGVKAVAFTDVFQFITFGISIPVFALFIWKIFGDIDLIKTATQHPLFDYRQLTDLSSPKLLPSVSLFFCFLIPGLSPTTFQRILMARDIKQIKYSFLIASLISLIIYITVCFVSFVIFAHNPNIEQNDLIVYIIDTYSFPELKLLLVLGVMAMIMSTADSWLNAGAVIFAHDICSFLGIRLKNELIISRLFTVFIGIVAVFFALVSKDLLDLLLLSANLYVPVVTVPLIMAIFGFRTTQIPFLIGVFTAVLTVLFWRIYIQPITEINSLLPGILANLITLLSSHYLLGEPGGWVKNEEENKSDDVKKKSFSQFLKNLSDNIKEFNLLEFYNKRLPYSSKTYIYFFVAVFLTLIITISIDEILYQEHLYLISIIQSLVLVIGVLFLCHGLLPEDFKKKYLGIIWYVSIFLSLVVISSFLVLLSKFSHVSLIVLTIHFALVPLLLGWRMAFFMIIVGLWLSFSMYESFIGEVIAGEIYNFKLKMLYILLMVGGFAATFLKSNQDEVEETKIRANSLENKVVSLEKEKDYFRREFENLSTGIDYLDNYFTNKENQYKEKNKYLRDKINLMSIEIAKLQDMKDEFLRNIPHESNAPLTGILSLSDALYSSYDSLNKKTIKDSIKNIVNSGDRLKSYIYNIMNLSKLTSLSYELEKKQVNLSELVKNRPYLYRKIFSDDKKQEFKFVLKMILW